MSILDKKIGLPDFTADQAFMRQAMTMRYQEILTYITDKLALDADGKPKNSYNQADINRQVSVIIRKLEKDIAVETEKTVSKAFLAGQSHHLATAYLLSKAEAKKIVGAEGKDAVEDSQGVPTPVYKDSPSKRTLNKMAKATLKKNGVSQADTLKLITEGKAQKKMMQALMSDTFGDILLATHNTEDSIKKVVREAVRDVTQYKGLLDSGYKEQADLLKDKLTKQGLSKSIVKDGFVGVTDRANRKWDLNTYSNMVVKTKTNQAFRQGLMYEAEEQGNDLAVISSHGATDKCKSWEGVVVSLTGKTRGYPALSEVIATNEIFHPNCEHSLHGLRELNQLDDKDIKQHKSNMQKVKGYKNRAYVRKKIKK